MIIEIFHTPTNGKQFQFVDGNALVTVIALHSVVIPLKCLSADLSQNKYHPYVVFLN